MPSGARTTPRAPPSCAPSASAASARPASATRPSSGGRLGEILVGRGVVQRDDVDDALRLQGGDPLTDTVGAAYAAAPVWEKSSPEAILHYVLGLAARKGASDVQIEPREDAVSVKYRIDGFS